MKLISTLILSALLSACSFWFPVQAGAGLPHFSQLAPRPGSRITALTLTDLTGQSVDLATEMRGRPTVLQLGSYSCPVFRYRRFDLQELMRQYGDRVRFLVIYTQEAHPAHAKSPYRDGEWNPLINRLSGVQLDQPETATERRRRAQWAQSAMSLESRFLLDTMDNSAWTALGKAPSPAWVINSEGFVQLSQPWVEPEEIAHTLDLLLSEDQ